MSSDEFKRMCQGEWVDLRPILVVSASRREYDAFMETVARESKAVTRRPGRWEVDGQTYTHIMDCDHMRGIRAKSVEFLGSAPTLKDYSEIRDYAKIVVLK